MANESDIPFFRDRGPTNPVGALPVADRKTTAILYKAMAARMKQPSRPATRTHSRVRGGKRSGRGIASDQKVKIGSDGHKYY